MIITILVLAAILCLLVFVHELGHFATAKFLGMKVHEFGFGFPPRMTAIERGGTEYSINWLPLGGFVRIKGEAGEANAEADSFASRPVWQRVAVLCAGVTMNFLLAWVMMTFGYMIGLPQVVEDLPANATVRSAEVQIYDVLKGSPADEAGFAAGDSLIEFNGTPVTDIAEFSAWTAATAGQTASVVVARDGQRLTKSVVPRLLSETEKTGIGVAVVKTGLVSYPFWLAPWRGLQTTFYYVREILNAFWSLFADLFAKRPVSVEFSGPVGIAVITAEVARLGFRHLLQFAALLSVNLAVINIVPFPALDGGRVMFAIVERIRGRGHGVKWEQTAHSVGFALLILLVIFVTFQDVMKYGGHLWSGAISRLGF